MLEKIKFQGVHHGVHHSRRASLTACITHGVGPRGYSQVGGTLVRLNMTLSSADAHVTVLLTPTPLTNERSHEHATVRYIQAELAYAYNL